MAERAMLLLFVLIASLGVWQLWRYRQQQRLQQIAAADLPPVLVGHLPAGPTVLYFTGEHCAQCRLQQTPILQQLLATVQINLYTVDAIAEQGLANFYGVMTLPTTVVLDSAHTPQAINHGLAPFQQLRQQIADLN